MNCVGVLVVLKWGGEKRGRDINDKRDKINRSGYGRNPRQ